MTFGVWLDDRVYAPRFTGANHSPCLIPMVVRCIVLVKRKNIRDLWECSWDCGFKHEKIGVVSWHETHDHCNKKPSAYDYAGENFQLTWKTF